VSPRAKKLVDAKALRDPHRLYGTLIHLSSAVLLTCFVHAGCGEQVLEPPQVASVRVVPDFFRLVALGEARQLAATAFDADGNTIAGVSFAWESYDEGTVTVDASGVVTAVSEGTSVITAAAGDKSGSATVRVDQEIAEVTASPSDTTITSLGDTLRLAVTAYDGNGNQIQGRQVSWQSSNGSIATVSEDGLVRSVDNGSALIVGAAGELADTAEILVSQVADYLTFETQPQNVLEKAVFNPAIQVAARDANGHPVTAAAPAVTLSLVTTGVGSLSGNTNVLPVGGIAVFDSVWVELAGAGSILRASAAGVADGSSETFDVLPSDLLYVVNNTGFVQVLHVGGQDIIHTIPVGSAPLEITISPDESRAYVANGSSNSISVIETRTHRVIANIAVGESPRGLGFTPDGEHLYVAHSQIQCCPSGSQLMVIETATNTVVETVVVPGGAKDVTVDPSGHVAYVASWSASSVAAIDIPTHTVIDEAVVIRAEQIAFSPRDTMAYVTGDAIWTIDPGDHQLTDYVALPSYAIAFLPSGDAAFVGHSLGSSLVSRIETANNTVVDQINVGDRYIFGIAAAGDGRLAYVSHDNSGGVVGPGSVSVIDVATNEIVAVIPAGDRPRGIIAFRDN